MIVVQRRMRCLLPWLHDRGMPTNQGNCHPLPSTCKNDRKKAENDGNIISRCSAKGAVCVQDMTPQSCLNPLLSWSPEMGDGHMKSAFAGVPNVGTKMASVGPGKRPFGGVLKGVLNQKILFLKTPLNA